METSGYSIWLIPEKNIFDGLRTTIRDLAKQYKTPDFEPHLTLFSMTDGVEKDFKIKINHLVRELKKIQICFKGYGRQNSYFSSLFLKAKQSSELISAHKLAKKGLSIIDNGEYQPHLSLIYGFFDEKTKDKIEKDLTEKDFPGRCFMASRLALFRTEGRVKEWKKVVEYNLTAG